MEETNPLTRAVVGTFQSTIQLTQQRSLVITGHIYSDDTKPEINERIDLYQDVLDRQFIRADILNKKAQVTAQLQGIEQFKQQLEDLKVRQHAVGTKKISSQEKLALQNGEQTIINAQKNIDRLEADIADAEKKLAA